jgi:hypothetical protein
LRLGLAAAQERKGRREKEEVREAWHDQFPKAAGRPAGKQSPTSMTIGVETCEKSESADNIGQEKLADEKMLAEPVVSGFAGHVMNWV